jgi:hypothetical protein
MLVRFHFTPAGWFWYVAEEQAGPFAMTRRFSTSGNFNASSTFRRRSSFKIRPPQQQPTRRAGR